MPIIFRPTRGTLAEAMSEKQEFNNESEMKEYIVKQWNNVFNVEDVVIGTTTIDDTRIGWKDTMYVCIKREGTYNYVELFGYPQCIGYCATQY